MTDITPIFPLNLVIFPDSKYKLHIFEERYKEMINKCLSNQTGFGVVSSVNDIKSNIGCFVLIDEVLKEYTNGNMDIKVKGIYRFEIIEIQMNSSGYFEAMIQRFIDKEPKFNQEIYQKTLENFIRVLKKFDVSLDDNFWHHLSQISLKSFKLAEKSGLNIIQQQSLLNLSSENKRLNFLNDHFVKLFRFIDQTHIIKEIIQNDGYL